MLWIFLLGFLWLHPTNVGTFPFCLSWGIFKISSLISSLTNWLLTSMLFSLYIFVNFAVFSLKLISNFIPLWWDITSILLNLLTCFVAVRPHMIYPGKGFKCIWEEHIFGCFWMNALCVYLCVSVCACVY